MKRTMKILFCLLLTLVMALQFGVPAARAAAPGDGAAVTVVVSAPVTHSGGDPDEISLDPAGSVEVLGNLGDVGLASLLNNFATVGDLRANGLLITPPEGWAVKTLALVPAEKAALDGSEQGLLGYAAATTQDDDFGAIIVEATTFDLDTVFDGSTGDCKLFIELAPVTYTAAVPSTCSRNGTAAYYTMGGDKYQDECCLTEADNAYLTLPIDANAHTFDNVLPSYTWSNDNSSCRAIRVCSGCNIDDDENGSVSSSVIRSATCTESEITRYTATFTNPAFATQTKDVETAPALDRDWGAPSYTWADNSSCTATRVCSRDASHVETETVATSAVTTADCTQAGTTTYTATFTNPAFAQQVKEVAVDALGHDWTISYAWSDDNSKCTATAVCSRGDHPVTETVDTSSAVTKAATCSAAGEITYTATFTDPLFSAQTKPVETAVDPAAHALVHYDAVPATALHNGSIEYWSCSICGKNFSDAAGTTEITDPNALIIPATGAPMAEGTETAWSPADKDGLTIHIDADYDRDYAVDPSALTVKIGDSFVPADKLTVTRGSVVVTIDPSYLATLAPGTHTIIIHFPSGHDVTTTVTITGTNALALTIDESGFTKVYDGTSFDLNSLKNYITVVNLPTGYKAGVSITFEDSSVTEFHNAGTTTLCLTLTSVKDASDVDVTSSFTCAPLTGVKLTIEKRKITVETRSDSKVYDGVAWTYTHMSNPQPIMTYTDPKLGEYVRGGNTYVQTISIKYTAAPKNMGVYDNTAELIIREKVKGSSETGTDVTSNYDITYKFGKIKITDANGNVPSTSTPVTGDTNNIWLWLGLMAAALALAVVLLLVLRKNGKGDEAPSSGAGE